MFSLEIPFSVFLTRDQFRYCVNHKYSAMHLSEKKDLSGLAQCGSPRLYGLAQCGSPRLQNIQILNKTVVIAITLHVYVLIACDERRQSLHANNQLVSIVIIILKVGNLIKLSLHIPQNNRKILEISR